MKVSYSCIDNLQTIVKKHRKILETSEIPSTENNCNCWKKNHYPLKSSCPTSSVVYNANANFTINWSILATAPAYSNKSKRCHLCLTEKLYLVRAKKPSLLNKRTELISKCRHENKFYLANFTSRQQ